MKEWRSSRFLLAGTTWWALQNSTDIF